ncbi:MAG: methionine ABC transporter permease [Oscillospiraceae bacterium]
MFENGLFMLLVNGLWETLYMTLVSTALAYAIGLPLGVIVSATDKDGVKPCPIVNKILGFVINFVRSVPFIILLISILPVTRFLVGTTIGSTATIVPLVFASAPYIARLVESSIKEVDSGVIEAAQSMGTPPLKMITKVLLPESKPSLIVGSAIAVTTILGYTAMAGFVGGGGLGAIAINYGYNRYNSQVMFVTVLILVVVVQVFQEVGMRLARKLDKRIHH